MQRVGVGCSCDRGVPHAVRLLLLLTGVGTRGDMRKA